MPELLRDAFGDALARAFFLRDPSPHLDYHLDPRHQLLLSASDGSPSCASSMYKSSQQYETQKFLEYPYSSYVDAVGSRGPSSFLSMDCEANHPPPQQQQMGGGGGYLNYGLPNYPPMQLDAPMLNLEVPEIDDCSAWILDDLPAISNQELAPLASSSNASLNTLMPCASDYSPAALDLPQTSLPPLLPDSPMGGESVASPPRPPLPASSVRSKSGVSSPRALGPEEPSSVSTTPKPLKPRGYKRCQRAVEKPKKEVELGHGRRERQRKEETSFKMSTLECLLPPEGPKLEHVRRERMRRDDMSYKISTLESLLPPAGQNMKRDRASIVHDGVHYVKSLQEKVKELDRVFKDMEMEKSTRPSARSVEGPIATKMEIEPCVLTKPELVEYHIQVEGGGEAAARIERCRCRSDYMSSSMKALEQLNLDLCRCTVVKMVDYRICVIVAKPRLTSSQAASLPFIISTLRSAVEIS